jgi:hypothetical protein
MQRLLAYWLERFRELDRLLRGDSTRPDAIEGQTLDLSARGLAILCVVLAMFYGACMGSFSLLKPVPDTLDDPYGPVMQFFASMVKTPALFFLTLLVTLPSLYVANALIGSRLTLLGITRLLVGALGVNIAVLASLGTIVLFFSLTTASYPFIVLLNVVVFGVAGILGLMFLLQTLHRVTYDHAEHPRVPMRRPAVDEMPLASDVVAPATDPPVTLEPDTPEVEGVQPETLEQTLEAVPAYRSTAEVEDLPYRTPSALDMPAGQSLARHTRVVFRVWIVLFSLVGAQMGWVLRPFIGNPETAFTFFRDRQSNFFSSVFGTLFEILFGAS